MNWRKVEVQNSESQIKTLVGDVRSAANKSMEALWNAFMEVPQRLCRGHEGAGGHLRPGGDRAAGGLHRLPAVPRVGADVHGGIFGGERGLHF